MLALYATAALQPGRAARMPRVVQSFSYGTSQQYPQILKSQVSVASFSAPVKRGLQRMLVTLCRGASLHDRQNRISFDG